MYKFFKLVGAKKFYCYEDGVMVKGADGEGVEVPTTDTTATEVEDEAVKTVKNLLGEATKKALETGDHAVATSLEKATQAITSLFGSFAEQAEKTAGSFKGGEAIKASFDAEVVKAEMLEVKTNKRQAMSFTINNKSDLDYLAKSTDNSDLTGDVIEMERLPEVTRPAVRQVYMEQICDTMDVGSNGLSYVESLTSSGAPASTAELATIPEKDFTFQEFKVPLKKVTVSNKHSVELLADAPQLVSVIKGWLATDLNIAIDDALLSGNGTGANLLGVLSVATLLNNASLGARIVPNANLFDVLRVAITKVQVAGKGQYVPTHIVLHPTDAEVLDLTKGSDGHYVMPPFISADGTTIKGVRVIVNTGMTLGSFLVGDFRYFHVGRKGGVEIEITNADGTDFVKDIITVKMRRRLASYIRSNDSGAFQYGVISEMITALTT